MPGMFFSRIGLIVFFLGVCGLLYGENEAQQILHQAAIEPDYSELTIPPNIAPMNFKIQEKGRAFKAKIVTETGEILEVSSKNGEIKWPLKRWKKLLSQNRGKRLTYTISIRTEKDGWQTYQSFVNQVAEEEVSTHLVYRLIDPMFTQSRVMGLYERDLTCFKERPLIHTQAMEACYNCHSFHNKKSDRMMLHVRGGGEKKPAGTFIYYDGEIKKIDTTTELNKRPGAYRSWHPNGEMIAFSVNVVRQFFHSSGYTQEGYDKMSDLIVYDIEKNTVTSNPQIADPRYMETYPEWSPDGDYLYYCRAEQPDSNSVFEEAVVKIMYDLMRIRYDWKNNQWGQPEMVLSTQETGLSIAQPRISPDGRFLSFAMTPHGTFSIHRPCGDVYVMDVETGRYQPIEGNSDRPESYNSWSHNSRWLVYSSKKRDNFLSRPYLTYIDENGKSHKSFIVPQEDPEFYDSYIITYNVPEFVNEAVKLDGRELIKTALSPNSTQKAVLDSTLNLDAFTGATVQSSAEEDDYLFQ